MSRYDELRVHHTRSPDERMALLEQELRAPLEQAAQVAAELGAVDQAAAPELFGGRFGELIEILGISAAKLAEVAQQLPALRARAAGGLSDEDVHAFRHDLLTPIGTVRGVAGMLARADTSEASGLPPEFAGKAESLAATLNDIKDVLDALTDARDRG